MLISVSFVVASSHPPTRIVAAKAADAYTTGEDEGAQEIHDNDEERLFVRRRTLILC